MAVKKSIAIIGEGETEWWYFETLRIACRYKFKVAPDFPQHSDIPHMAKLAEDYVKRETDNVVCLVDMDRLLRLPAEMATYQQLRKSSSPNVIWIETNPCTEFWFLLHSLIDVHLCRHPEQAVHIHKAYHVVSIALYVFFCQLRHVRYIRMLGEVGGHLELIAACDAERVEVPPLRLAFANDCYTLLDCHVLLCFKVNTSKEWQIHQLALFVSVIWIHGLVQAE